MRHILTLAVSTLLLTTGLSSRAESQVLSPCHVDNFSEQVECGYLTVPEDYDNPGGATIDLHIVRLPAVATAAKPDPLVILAGGPGQAATELVGIMASRLQDVRSQRDLIFIDQRGTGKSNPLRCEFDDQYDRWTLLALPETELDSTEVARACAAALDVEFQHYSTLNAVRDFDQVRKELGYESVNLYGGSYGTRTGLVYMREYPFAVRAAILDGLAPPQVKIGLFGTSAASAFERLLADCENQANCASRFPQLRETYLQLTRDLDADPQLITLRSQRRHRLTEVLMTGNRIRDAIFPALYSPRSRQMLPLAIDQAAEGNFAPLMGLSLPFEDDPAIYHGLQLSVLCQEDLVRVDDADRASEAASPYIGDRALTTLTEFCRGWPVEPASETIWQPVTSEVPTLLLSGGQDPVTPPAWGELTAQTLSNSFHLVADAGGHTILGHTCANRIAARFLDEPQTKPDSSCLDQTRVLPFLLNVNASGM